MFLGPDEVTEHKAQTLTLETHAKGLEIILEKRKKETTGKDGNALISDFKKRKLLIYQRRILADHPRRYIFRNSLEFRSNCGAMHQDFSLCFVC